MRTSRLVWVLIVFLGATVFAAQEDSVMTEKEKAQFGLAQSFNNTQKFQKAIPLLKELHAKHPEDFKIQLEYAKALGYGGSPAEAIPLLQALVKEEPDDTYIKNTLASVYETAQMPKEAREVYGSLLKAHPDNREIILKMATLSLWLKDDKAAAAYMEKALRAKDDELMRRQLVEALLRIGDLTSAEKAALGLPEGKIGSERLLQIAGKAQAKSDWASAARIYKELIDRDPEDRTLRLEYAKAVGYGGNPRKAISLLEELREKAPADIPLLRTLATMYETAGRPEDARAAYQELSNKEPGDMALKMKVADTAEWAGDYDVAAKACRELIKVRGEDAKLKEKLINILYSAGQDDEARKELAGFVKAGGLSTERMMQIAGKLVGNLEFDRARALYRDILSVEPGNQMAALWEARILSWQKLYDEALEKYDELIAQYPDWVVPAREKARVYGWARRYPESLDGLDEIIRRFPAVKGLPLERDAKRHYYNIRYRRALVAYDRWLEEEPDDLEAMFDRAQILSILKKWSLADAAYRQILKRDDSHFRSRYALERVDREAGSVKSELFLEKFMADSESRDVDRDSETAMMLLTVPAFSHVNIAGRYEYGTYWFKDSQSRVRQFPQAGIELFDLPWSTDIRASIGETKFEDATNWLTVGQAVLTTRPVDALVLDMGVITDHLLDNNEVINREIDRETRLARVGLNITRRLAVSADMQEDRYSDRNVRKEWGAEATAHVPSGANDLSFTVRHEEYGFDDESDFYFSPDDFLSDQLTVQWRQFFGSTELFWGSNTRFYTVKYTIQMDSNDEVGHSFYGDIHMDLNDRSQVSVEYARTIYEDSDVYDDERIALYGRFFF